MKTIIAILAAVQILHCSGQSLNETADDSINKLNEDSTLTNLLTMTRYELTGVTLTVQGLQVNLKFNAQETNCAKESGVILAECALKPTPSAIIVNCTSIARYANGEIQNVEVICTDYKQQDVNIFNIVAAQNATTTPTTAPTTTTPTTTPTTTKPTTTPTTTTKPTTTRNSDSSDSSDSESESDSNES